jgi:His-Xaa-Ser system radical SAM maturase HxsB
MKQYTLRYYPRLVPAEPGAGASYHVPRNALQTTVSLGSFPFNVRQLPDNSLLAISASGDHLFLTADELTMLRDQPNTLSLERRAELQARFFLGNIADKPGTRRLLKSRQAEKRETIHAGPSLHIIVPTLQCANSCQYCQVSRSLEAEGFTMSLQDLDAACDSIFESSCRTLTVEFQGGDPLLRYDLVKHAILRIRLRNREEGRNLRFVVASTLHQLTAEMCEFFKEHGVFLSTSVDGPSWLHNKNRPSSDRNSYERTVEGIALARNLLGQDSVSALMTTTKASLGCANEIVDEYVRLGLQDIFLRPLSSYGFARRNQAHLGYTVDEFSAFYLKALDRVLYWNRQGVGIREVYATIVLNKILSTFDGGFVDLQSPTGAGSSVLVYNYDGYVYPSDEARMQAESGDVSLRMGRIGQPMVELLNSSVRHTLVQASLTAKIPSCVECTYNQFCAPNPVEAHSQNGSPFAPVHETEHCRRHLWLFDTLFLKLRSADDDLTDLFYRWAQPATGKAT